MGQCSADGSTPCPNLNGFVPFGASNLWNTRIDSAPVDPNNATIVSAPGFAGLHLHHDFSSATYGEGYPYAVVDSSTQPLVPIQLWDLPISQGGHTGLEDTLNDAGTSTQSDGVVAPIPLNVPIEGNGGSPGSGCPNTYVGDSHALVLDRHTCRLYELYGAHSCGGGSYLTALQETVWNAAGGTGDNMQGRPIGWTSADASGSSMYAGIIKYDEVASGHINHAIRYTMAQTNNDQNGGTWVPPASHPAGTGWGIVNVMGMRIRLKASFDISGYSPANQVILTAMKQYGMILADDGGYFFFQGASDSRWDDTDLANLDYIQSSNFEVVQMTPGWPGYSYTPDPVNNWGKLSTAIPCGGYFPCLGYAAPTVNSFTASATSIAPGEPVTFTYSTTGDTYDYIDNAGVGSSGSGSITIYPTQTNTYTLSATNLYGRTLSAPITVAISGSLIAAPTFSPAAGTYGSAQTVTISNATPSATIHYTTDGSTPTTSSPVYSGPISVGVSETVKAIAVAPGYPAPSAMGAATYTIGNPSAAAPVFSPAPGSYSSAQTVTIGTTTPSATIYYTTNGNVPTIASPVYSGPIAVSATETVQAIAVASGYTTSSIGSAAYTISSAAAPPAFSPAAGSYSSAQTVTIGTTTPSATIYYTTNGATPTTSSAVYSGPIAVSATETVQAIAVASGYSNSSPASATYTIGNQATAAPTFSPAAGTYSSAQTVTIGTTTPSATIYYTTNGSLPTTSSAVYSGPITVSGTETVGAIAVANGSPASAATYAAYTISTPVVTPSFYPNPGSYSSSQKVFIATSTPSATIYYTTDGSTPTASSTVYSGPVTVSTSETINAIAVIGGNTASQVGSAAYTIASASVAAAPSFTPAPGTYTSAQSVAISTTTPSATIYYTTNGSAPTTSSAVYSGPITVSATETVQAIAVASGYSNSSASSAVYTITVPAAAPSFSPAAGTYTSTQSVAISTTTPSATIYYTTNGSAPTTSSAVYSGPIAVSATETVQAIAVASGYSSSSASSAVYTITVPASAPSFSPASGTYTSAQSVAISTTTPSATIYYTTNGAAPTTSSAVYSGPIAVSATETVQAMAVASGYSNSSASSAVYTITLPAAAPSFSPAAGTYTSTQSVAISTTTPSATIYYTTNGSAPTTSSAVYSGPIAVSATETVRAITVASGYSNSSASSAVYTITVPAAAPSFSPASGTYTSTQSVAISTTTPSATIYYTTNGAAPTTSSAVYSGPIAVSATETVQAMAVASGYSNSSASSAVYTINLPQMTAPVFSLAPGTYSAPQTVTITASVPTSGGAVSTNGFTLTSNAAPSATIYYTTNGTVPTTASAVYSGPITVAASETLVAVAVASGYPTSSASSATYTINMPAAAPSFSPASGTYHSAQTVAIGTTTPSATIYYTTNGSAPTTSSAVYSGPISVAATETVQAIAVASGYSTSSVGSAVYTITLPAAVPSFSPAAGTYSSSQTVSILSATPSATIYYTTDGSAPTTNSAVYSGPIAVSASETLQAISVASGYSNSAAGAAVYTINLSPAATPFFSPAPGTYSSTQAVTIATTTPSATIYYTTNGSLPTTSSAVYTGPITVSGTETLGAIAVANGSPSSAANFAAYTIAPAVVAPSFYPAPGTYSSSQKVFIATSTPSATIYYTTNGSTPTANSAVYSGPVTVSNTETINAIAVVGGSVSSQVGSAAYNIALPAAAPSFSPASGTYTSAPIVAITTTTPSATIYYTTNGSVPTARSAVYTGPIAVSATETIQAIAVASGYSTSPEGTASYTVAIPQPTGPVTILSPSIGSTLTGSVAVVANITDQLDAAGSYLMVDGVENGTRRVVGAPYIYPLDTTTLANGQHTIQVWAHDTNNNTLLSNSVAVTVANGASLPQPPSATNPVAPVTSAPLSISYPIALTYPVNGQGISGLVSIAATINQQLDAAGSYLMVDGAEWGTSRLGSAPYVYTLNTASLTVGQHTLQVWAHDTNNDTLLSNPVTVTVGAPSFAVSLSSTTLTLANGQSATTTVTVTPQNGFAAPVTLSCFGLPAWAACSFSSATVTPLGGVATASLTVTATQKTAALGRRSSSTFPASILAISLCWFGRKRRRGLQLLMLAGFAAELSLCTGCATAGSDASAPGGVSTVAVVASNGTLQPSTTLTLMLQ